MKVNSNRDSVELSHLARSKRGEKASAVKTKEADKSEGAAASGDVNSIQISSEAKAMAAANQIAKAESVDQEKIDRIKAAIRAGSYKPDFGKVADKMINETLLQDS